MTFRNTFLAALWTGLSVLSLAVSAQTSPTGSKPSGSPPPANEAKKVLVQRVIQLQQGGVEKLARMLVERPAMQMMQAAAQAAQSQLPEDKREPAMKAIRSDIQRFVDEMNPTVRERALKLAPTTIGPLLDSKFSEDELRQLVAWLESPVSKKFQNTSMEIQDAFSQKLISEVSKTMDPKLRQLDAKTRVNLGLPPAPAVGSPAPKPATKP